MNVNKIKMIEVEKNTSGDMIILTHIPTGLTTFGKKSNEFKAWKDLKEMMQKYFAHQNSTMSIY